jgi:hypothetical protein
MYYFHFIFSPFLTYGFEFRNRIDKVIESGATTLV